MLRLNEIKLPIDHSADALPAAILRKLAIPADEMLSFTIFRRSHDARKRSAILLVYTVDVEVKNEARLLKKFADDRHVQVTPDMSYQFVAQAHASL